MSLAHSAQGWGLVPVILLVLAACALPAAAQSTSAHYRLQASTIDVAGGSASSASRTAVGAAGQEATVDASSSAHFVVQPGLLSFAGTAPVGIVLEVTLGGGAIHLTWSGNAALYDVYRSTNCAGVHTSPLTSTSSNGLVDSIQPRESIVCYDILTPGATP